MEHEIEVSTRDLGKRHAKYMPTEEGELAPCRQEGIFYSDDDERFYRANRVQRVDGRYYKKGFGYYAMSAALIGLVGGVLTGVGAALSLASATMFADMLLLGLLGAFAGPIALVALGSPIIWGIVICKDAMAKPVTIDELTPQQEKVKAPPIIVETPAVAKAEVAEQFDVAVTVTPPPRNEMSKKPVPQL